jgi:hypothetical protein
MKMAKQQLKQIIVEELRDYYGGKSHSQSERDAAQPRRPEVIMREEVQDLADKFGVEASVETASDGKPAILVWHKNGDVSAYHNGEEMYQDLQKRAGY